MHDHERSGLNLPVLVTNSYNLALIEVDHTNYVTGTTVS